MGQVVQMTGGSAHANLLWMTQDDTAVCKRSCFLRLGCRARISNAEKSSKTSSTFEKLERNLCAD